MHKPSMAKPWHSLLMLENRRWSRQAFGNTPKAQCAFKSLLIHEILLFSMLITLCCTLHHHPSQDIQCWKLWWHKGLTPWKQKRRQWVSKAQWCPNTAAGRQQAAYLAMADIPECMWGGSIAAHPHKHNVCEEAAQQHIHTSIHNTKSLCSCQKDVQMILPQVHLRKPCYDFSFL